MTDNSYIFYGVLVSVAFSILVGRYGEKKGFPFSRGLFLSILLSPILGAIIIGFMKEQKK